MNQQAFLPRRRGVNTVSLSGRMRSVANTQHCRGGVTAATDTAETHTHGRAPAKCIYKPKWQARFGPWAVICLPLWQHVEAILASEWGPVGEDGHSTVLAKSSHYTLASDRPVLQSQFFSSHTAHSRCYGQNVCALPPPLPQIHMWKP